MSKEKNQNKTKKSITSVPSVDEFTPFSRREILSINIRITSKMLKFQRYKRQLRAVSPGVRCCPLFQSSEMMSGALPPLLVITPVSLLLEELTCVLLSW